MGTQLTGRQLEHIAAITNELGAEFDYQYTFVSARAAGGDTLLQITVHVVAYDFQESGQDRLVKGFWASYPEGDPDDPNPVDIPAVNETVKSVNINVQKRIKQDVSQFKNRR